MTGSSNPMRLEFVCLFVRLFFCSLLFWPQKVCVCKSSIWLTLVYLADGFAFFVVVFVVVRTSMFFSFSLVF